MTVVGVGHALADAFAFVGEDVPKSMGLHPGTYNRIPDYRMRAILATMKSHALMAGGSAANTVKLAARLGLDAHFLGKCGHDQAGQIFESELAEAGVKVNLTRSDAPTGTCVTLLSSAQDRTAATLRSASGGLNAGMVGETLLRTADVLVAEGYLLEEPEFFLDLVTRCRMFKTPIALDIGDSSLVERHAIALLGAVASGAVRYFFLRESDAASLTGLDAEGALARLSTTCEAVVLQRPERGWIVLSEGKVTAIPLAGSVTVDPTGSADGFQAGFLWGISQGWNVVDSCRSGSLVAGCVVEQPGTRIDAVRWTKLLDELRQFADQRRPQPTGKS